MPDLASHRRVRSSLKWKPLRTIATGNSITRSLRPGFTGQQNMLVAWWQFLTRKTENARPAQPLPLVKTDLASLSPEQDTLVWLGHSSGICSWQGNAS